MKRACCLPAIFLILSCAKVLPVYKIPPITVGEPSFFPTIEPIPTPPSWSIIASCF